MLIRESTLEDVPQFDVIRVASFPWFVPTVAAQRSWLLSNPPQARRLHLAAEIDGQVVGFAHGSIHLATKEDGVGSVAVVLHPSFRGRGIARALYEPIEAHLREIGTKRATGYASDDPGTIAWTERQGWTKGHSARYSRMDPRQLPPMPAFATGLEVTSLETLTPEAVYAVDIAGGADEPGDVAHDGLPYDLWLERMWEDPDLRRDLSQAAIVDGVIASLTFIEANLSTGRMWSGGTCTLPEYRGRGLAKVLKSVALRKAAEAGITTAITANDYTNGPMLAINNWLGYEVFASQYTVLKAF